MSSRFSSNTEANASELLENLEVGLSQHFTYKSLNVQ